MKRIEENEIFIDQYSVMLDNELPITYVSPVGVVPGHFTGTDAEDPNFPIDNIVDLHPQKVARGTVDSILISIPLPFGYSNAVALFNTNATSAIVSVINTGDDDPDYADGEEVFSVLLELQGAKTYQQLISDRDKPSQKEFFVEYPFRSTSHVVNIFLTGSVDGSGKIDTGVVFVGRSFTSAEPLLGLTQTFKDFSLVSELATGATYILKRDIVRVFTMTIDMCVDTDEPRRLQKTFADIGPEPIPWLITEDEQSSWLVFARKNSEPSGSFYSHNRVKANLSLIEVL